MNSLPVRVFKTFTGDEVIAAYVTQHSTQTFKLLFPQIVKATGWIPKAPIPAHRGMCMVDGTVLDLTTPWIMSNPSASVDISFDKVIYADVPDEVKNAYLAAIKRFQPNQDQDQNPDQDPA